ncbi:MAG: hypothetical protein PHW56_02200 [Methanosarcinaceae archaeon]|nr:hypothetical protein [Methanosarcinaceae archaeon]
MRGIFTTAGFIRYFLYDRGSGVYRAPLHADMSFLDSRFNRLQFFPSVLQFIGCVFILSLKELDLTHFPVNPAGFGAASLIPGSDRTPPENSRVFGDAFAKISLI